MGRGRLRNSLKSSVCNVSPSSNINKVRMGRTIHIAFISQIIFEAAKIKRENYYIDEYESEVDEYVLQNRSTKQKC